MSEAMKQQPDDGEAVAQCGHDEPRHLFYLPDGFPTECLDPECEIHVASWYACCDECFAMTQRTGDISIEKHATWVGDEPVTFTKQAPR